MSSVLLRHHNLLPFIHHLSFSSLAAVTSVSHTKAWNRVRISVIQPATSDSIDVSNNPDLFTSHTLPGQYIQVRQPEIPEAKRAFLAIASCPPTKAVERGEFEFPVEPVAGMGRGKVVELSTVMGKGFPVGRIDGGRSVDKFVNFALVVAVYQLRFRILFYHGPMPAGTVEEGMYRLHLLQHICEVNWIEKRTLQHFTVWLLIWKLWRCMRQYIRSQQNEGIRNNFNR